MDFLERKKKLSRRQEIHYEEQKIFLFASGMNTSDSVYEALNRAERI